MSSSKKKGSGKKGFVGILIAVCIIAAAIFVCVMGFRDGGWFRNKSGQDMQSLQDYAKQLEADGNSEAAAAVYDLIAKNGGGGLVQKANEEIPVVKADNTIEQFRRFMSGSEAGDNK